MKRLRSCGDDPDLIGNKGICKDWVRKDQVVDRSSSHRRYYSKSENERKGLSIDGNRETSRSLRKHLDNDSRDFDRRKSFDRYRDCSDREISISSARNAYSNGERIDRSDSFSEFRWNFPKRVRSARNHSLRGESVSSWQRLSGSKDVDGDTRFVVDSGRGSRVASEDRGNVRSPQGSIDVKSPHCSKDFGSDQSKSAEVKNDGVRGESGSSSEMEEGELEPEPELKYELESKTEPQSRTLVGENTGSGMNLENEAKSLPEGVVEIKENGASDGKQGVEALGTLTDMIKEIVESPDFQKNSGNVLSGNEAYNGGGEKEEIFKENHMCFPSLDHKSEGEGNKEAIERMTPKHSLPLEEERQNEHKHIDLKIEAQVIDSLDSNKEVAEENRIPEVTVTLITDKLTQNTKDKGKSFAVSPSNESNSKKDGGWMQRDLLTSRDDAMVGPSTRGFELFCKPAVTKSVRTNDSGVNKHKDEKLKLEPFELSLGLPNASLPLTSHDPNPAPNSISRARSVQSMPATYRTNSDGFTASVSFSGSQTFVHNPSCSLTHNSFDDYEQSVGSHPIFQGVDWQGQSSTNEPKDKDVPLYNRMLLNGDGALHASQASKGILNQTMQGQQRHLKISEGSSGLSIGLDQHSSLPRQLTGTQSRYHNEVGSPTHSAGFRKTTSENSKDKNQIMIDKSRGSLLRSSSQRKMEQLVISGTGFVERIITMIVSEPVEVMAKEIHEMTEQSIVFLRESACEIIENKDRLGKLCAFQEALQNRSDLTLETLSKAHRAQLKILVAVKTGLKDFLQHANNTSSSDLAKIFLKLKCRNLNCQSVLPVDECDCKVCTEKNGFCSACMCIVCSKFDTALNTCSWVGCDVCLHWCHADCGLRESYIRNGRSIIGAQGTSEMQFHCFACGHPSGMFGFVKEVFKTFAKEWKAEKLSKELGYVRRIFCGSNDLRGKQLYDVADQMLGRLENESHLPQVYNHIIRFLTESDSKFGNTSVNELPQKNQGEGSNRVVGLSQEPMWLTSVSTEEAFPIENACNVRLDWDQMDRCTGDLKSQKTADKKPVVDGLETVMKIKRAEAKMFQGRADDARREAEGLKRIAIAKSETIEEEYSSRVARLRLDEAEKRRRQKLEELQGLERAHWEYFNVKKRMEVDIKELLLRMEATSRNFIM